MYPNHTTRRAHNFIDRTGQKYNRLTVIEVAPTPPHVKKKEVYWRCVCECGNEAIVSSSELGGGHTKSCGCLNREKWHAVITKHGGRHTPEWQVWCGMRQRCRNSNDRNYGSRGITVCDRWLHSFENFLADMGPRPGPDYSIDRIDNNGPYSPDNCRWTTVVVQQNNTRRNHYVTYDGETHTVKEWARLKGIPYARLFARLRYDLPLDEVFSTEKIARKGRPHRRNRHDGTHEKPES